MKQIFENLLKYLSDYDIISTDIFLYGGIIWKKII